MRAACGHGRRGQLRGRGGNAGRGGADPDADATAECPHARGFAATLRGVRVRLRRRFLHGVLPLLLSGGRLVSLRKVVAWS